MQGAPTGSVHQGYGDECHDNHDQSNADGSILGMRLGQASGNKQVGRVVKDLQKANENAYKGLKWWDKALQGLNQLTALIPESCCDNCIMMAMRRGSLSVGEVTNSKSVILASAI